MLNAALLRMQAVFAPRMLTLGESAQAQGHVLAIRLSDGLVRARVKDAANHIYDVYFDLKAWPKTPARCACIEKHNCLHAAACFFELKARQTPGFKSANASPMSQYRGASSSDLFHEEILDADDAQWYSAIQNTGHEFFAYQLGISVEGKSINIVPLVVDLLKRFEPSTLEFLPDDKPIKLPFEKGKVLQIPLGRIKPLLRLLLQFNKAQSDVMMVKPAQLLLMHEAELAMQATQARWNGTKEICEKLSQLSALHTLPKVSVPKGLKTSLRPYQQQGINWLQFLQNQQFGGVLADDMGLGKTVQTLAHLQIEKESGRLKQASLIIAPTSLVGNWLEEAKRFTPELKVLVFHGTGRHQDNFDEYDVVISTYGLILRDKARFLAYSFYYVILDEAQCIKNARTKTTQIVHQIKTKHRLCLTGTPLENHLGELWSLFHFLIPGLLGTPKEFRQFFRIPIEREQNESRQALLRGRVRPFMLRRTKGAVVKELPLKTEIIRSVELTGPQRDLYEAIRMSMEKKVREIIASQGLGKSHIVLLDALLKLRQICCDPRLLSLQEAVIAHDSSAKLEVLTELLDNLMEEDRRVLVFSQFTSMLKLIEKVLNARGYKYVKLTGETTNRQKIVREFQEGLAPIFLISLKAGGTGLNLTRADTVIHYDPWWNPAVEDQATDRAHRIGQENPVFVYKLLTTGTVEEVIMRMQDKKRQLFDDMLQGSGLKKNLFTAEDIQQFFAPLSHLASI